MILFYLKILQILNCERVYYIKLINDDLQKSITIITKFKKLNKDANLENNNRIFCCVNKCSNESSS